ncbi:MAG: hypothetical protein FJX76_23955 [Armatimonadetes bacterium]|nr:hypothetical protein [Armatimonadota bacterium]
MKRLLAIVALCFLPLAAAWAEDKTYADPDGYYQLAYPDTLALDVDSKTKAIRLINGDQTFVLAMNKANPGMALPTQNIQKLVEQYPMFEQEAVSMVKKQGFTIGPRQTGDFKGIPSLSYTLQNPQMDGIFTTFIHRNFIFMMVYARKTGTEDAAGLYNSVIDGIQLN